jgi:hypothetical protein
VRPCPNRLPKLSLPPRASATSTSCLSTATTIAPLPCFHADNLPPHLFTLEVEPPVR